jgi:hypothetical protein
MGKKKKSKIEKGDKVVTPAIRAQAFPKSEKPDVWPLVIKDMEERDRLGKAKYGIPLRSFNGRDPLIDAYQEVLDMSVYLRQEIEERLYVDDIIRSLRRIPGLEDVNTGNLLENVDFLVQRICSVEERSVSLASTVLHYQSTDQFLAGYHAGIETTTRIFEAARGEDLTDEEYEEVCNEAERELANTPGHAS